MISFGEEIERCLQEIRNTNNKEQNFQGQLYRYFWDKYASLGYVVEMETSILDEHIKPEIEKRAKISGKLSNEDFKDNFAKTEMDLLIYKEDFSEIYAAELKWIYHREHHWNPLDYLKKFKEDAEFCRELKEKARFTETCCVVVYDFDERKLIKSPRILDTKEITKEEKLLFLGGEYSLLPKGGKLCGKKFEWKPLSHNTNDYQNNRYYILTF